MNWENTFPVKAVVARLRWEILYVQNPNLGECYRGKMEVLKRK